MWQLTFLTKKTTDIVFKIHKFKKKNKEKLQLEEHLSIYFACLSNKRQNGQTDRAQIFGGTSLEPREGS